MNALYPDPSIHTAMLPAYHYSMRHHTRRRASHTLMVVLCSFLRFWATMTAHAASDVLVVLSAREAQGSMKWKDTLPITAAQAGARTIVMSDNSTQLELPPEILHFHTSTRSSSSTQSQQLLEPLEVLRAIQSGILKEKNRTGSSISTFKWLLWGAPTTLVLRDNLQAVLQPFDSKLPYVITDHTYRSSTAYPACLPCHWGRSRSKPLQGTSALVVPPAGGCCLLVCGVHMPVAAFNCPTMGVWRRSADCIWSLLQR